MKASEPETDAVPSFTSEGGVKDTSAVALDVPSQAVDTPVLGPVQGAQTTQSTTVPIVVVHRHLLCRASLFRFISIAYIGLSELDSKCVSRFDVLAREKKQPCARGCVAYTCALPRHSSLARGAHHCCTFFQKEDTYLSYVAAARTHCNYSAVQCADGVP